MASGTVGKQDETWERQVEIKKLDEDRQLVFGWLSVAVDKAGTPVVDSQGDIILSEDLEQAAYDYMLYARQAGEMHKRTGIGQPVESMFFSKEKQTALGIPSGMLPVGWWIGFHVSDADVWKKVKSGEYSAFSIGGSGKRESYAE